MDEEIEQQALALEEYLSLQSLEEEDLRLTYQNCIE